jgi:hypothetical protein
MDVLLSEEVSLDSSRLPLICWICLGGENG